MCPARLRTRKPCPKAGSEETSGRLASSDHGGFRASRRVILSARVRGTFGSDVGARSNMLRCTPRPRCARHGPPDVERDALAKAPDTVAKTCEAWPAHPRPAERSGSVVDDNSLVRGLDVAAVIDVQSRAHSSARCAATSRVPGLRRLGRADHTSHGACSHVRGSRRPCANERRCRTRAAPCRVPGLRQWGRAGHTSHGACSHARWSELRSTFSHARDRTGDPRPRSCRFPRKSLDAI